VLDRGPAVLRDVAMATNFGTKIAINWLTVNDIAFKQLVMEGFELSADTVQILPMPCT